MKLIDFNFCIVVVTIKYFRFCGHNTIKNKNVIGFKSINFMYLNLYYILLVTINLNEVITF